MKRELTPNRILKAVNHWIVFFLLAAFVVTCCMMLFITILSGTLDITLTEEHLSVAAKLTFANVLLVSFLFTVIDGLRRKLMIDKPTKRITSAAERIMKGDFSVRIAPLKNSYAYESFNQIIECFNRMTEELSGTETLRTDFIANVSHELKTPLAIMQNYGTLLRQADLPEEKRQEYAKAITDACQRLANLITNILKLNKLENQQIFPATSEYDLSEQICQCLLQYEDTWERKNISIETDIEDCVRINSDSELLELVWNNLLSNAFKFTEDGGTVSLTLTTDKHNIFVSVSDTGCGISNEAGRHIFEKFYQGDRSRSVQGNGLGLALVKRVADIIGGEISVESELGKGSTFTVKLKRGNSHESENEAE